MRLGSGRRRLLGLLAVGLATVGLAGRAQRPAPPRRIGVLAPGSVADIARFPEPLVEGLRELGWIEGQNLLIERRVADDKAERLPALAEELVAAKVEVIVTSGTPAALAARAATSSIAIVMASIFDPVRAGLVESLARPGGNVTGNTLIEPDLGTKRLQILRELLPGVSRVGEFGNPNNPALAMLRRGEEDALRQLGLQAIFIEVGSAVELDASFAELKRRQAQALVVHSDTLFVSNRARIAQLALMHQLPIMAEGRQFVEAGGLVSYAPSQQAMMRKAAAFVDKILRGARPGDLPVERPTTFELVFNLRTAKALGIAIPQSLLLRADEVIQ